MASIGYDEESAKAIRDATCDSLKRIYIVILGLAITQALLRTFSDEGEFVGIRFWDSKHRTGILLLVAFLPTAIRFAHGGILHLSAFTRVSNWRQDMFGLLLQAMFFFIAAMSTRDILLFLVSFSALLVIDSSWLLIVKGAHAQPKMLRQWLASNALLLALSVALALLQWFLAERVPAVGAAACLAFFSLLATVHDYSTNKDQYFPPPLETESR